MSNNYSNGNKTIKDMEEYNSFIKKYKDNKYDDITSNFKDNSITNGDINVKLNYKLEDVKNLIFLSNDKELVIVLLNKDLNNLYHMIISKNVNTESNNNVKLGNIITFEWNTKSNSNSNSNSSSYIWLYISIGIILLLIILFYIYKYLQNKKKNKVTPIINNSKILNKFE